MVEYELTWHPRGVNGKLAKQSTQFFFFFVFRVYTAQYKQNRYLANQGGRRVKSTLKRHFVKLTMWTICQYLRWHKKRKLHSLYDRFLTEAQVKWSQLRPLGNSNPD